MLNRKMPSRALQREQNNCKIHVGHRVTPLTDWHDTIAESHCWHWHMCYSHSLTIDWDLSVDLMFRDDLMFKDDLIPSLTAILTNLTDLGEGVDSYLKLSVLRDEGDTSPNVLADLVLLISAFKALIRLGNIRYPSVLRNSAKCFCSAEYAVCLISRNIPRFGSAIMSIKRFLSILLIGTSKAEPAAP